MLAVPFSTSQARLKAHWHSLALKPPIPKGPGVISRYASRPPPPGLRRVAKAPEWGVARTGRGVGSAGGSAK